MVLVAACSAPDEPDSTNNNTAASDQQNGPQVSNVSAPPAATDPVPPLTLPTSKLPDPTAANGAAPTPPATGSVPKLVVPKTTIDFGKQPKEKSLARTFVIKNGGTAELKIDAVEPS